MIPPELPPVCYIRHPTSGATILIRRDVTGYYPVADADLPECLNSKLDRPPTPAEVVAMTHGSLFGWNTPGADPAFWTRVDDANAQ